MRALCFFIVILALLAFGGWLTFSYGPGRASVNLETTEIREDTQEVVRSGAKILDKAGDELKPSDDAQEPLEGKADRRTADRQ